MFEKESFGANVQDQSDAVILGIHCRAIQVWNVCKQAECSTNAIAKQGAHKWMARVAVALPAVGT